MGVRAKAVAALCGLTFALLVGVAASGGAPSAQAVECIGTAALTTSVASASQGMAVTVNGACFTANSNVQVTFADGSLQAPVGTATTDGSGSFTAPLSFTIPANAAPGTGVGVFTGDDGTLSPATAAIDITGCKSDAPVLTVSPTSTPRLGTVDVAGNCFTADDPITLSLTAGDGTTPAPAITTTPASITADDGGAFTASFTVPLTTLTGPSGKVTADDGHDGEATADLAITDCTPALSLDPATTAPGTNVTVTGSCFTPSKAVTLTFKDSADATTDVSPATKPTVGSDGSFTATITVPAAAAPGTATVTGADAATPPATAVANLTVVPAGPTTSTPAGCDTSTSSTTSSTTSSSSTSSSSTSSSTTSSTTTSSTTTTVASARAFADDASTTTVVTYNATMAADPSTVAAGGTTTVSGTGFTPCAEVTLTLHSDPVALGTVTADATGAFSKPVTIPASTPAGSHTITGAAGNTNGIVTLTVTAAGSTTSAGSGSSSTAAVTPAQSGGPLAFTGAHAALYGGLGMLLVLAGGAVAYLARRRRLENARWHEI